MQISFCNLGIFIRVVINVFLVTGGLMDLWTTFRELQVDHKTTADTQ